MVEIDHGMLARAFRKEGVVYYWGWADYNDVLTGTDRHRTEFCFEIDVRTDPMKGPSAIIGFRPTTKHNGADEDCLYKPSPAPP